MNFKKSLILLIIVAVVVLIGRALFTDHQVVNIKNITEQKNMKIKSDIFMNNGDIPTEYTCYGKKMQPPLKISDVPKEAKSLALIVDDPDAPNGDFVHWILWNLDPKTSIIENASVPEETVEGYTSENKAGWVAPCPPSGVHHYNFKLYALDTLLSIAKSSTKTDLIRAMDGHIIDDATLVGLYGRE